MSAQSGRPPLPAMSERLTAMAFQPMSKGEAQARRKCTSSTTTSVVASRSAPGSGRSTAVSSPMPISTRSAGPRRAIRRMSRISSSSPAAELPAADLPAADLPAADLPAADLPAADLVVRWRPSRDSHRAREQEKVAQERLALAREDRLGVELDALDSEAPVAQPHDLADLGPRRHFEVFGQALVQHDERVVARRFEVLRKSLEDTAAVVVDARGLAVHLLAGAGHGASEGLADRLVPETDAQDGRALVQAADEGQRDAGAVRISGARGDDDPVGGHARDFFDGDLVVAHDAHRGALLAEVLDEVVRERVVVVEDEDHGWPSCRPRSC